MRGCCAAFVLFSDKREERKEKREEIMYRLSAMDSNSCKAAFHAALPHIESVAKGDSLSFHFSLFSFLSYLGEQEIYSAR